jgi:hypothetical protein
MKDCLLIIRLLNDALSTAEIICLYQHLPEGAKETNSLNQANQ